MVPALIDMVPALIEWALSAEPRFGDPQPPFNPSILKGLFTGRKTVCVRPLGEYGVRPKGSTGRGVGSCGVTAGYGDRWPSAKEAPRQCADVKQGLYPPGPPYLQNRRTHCVEAPYD